MKREPINQEIVEGLIRGEQEAYRLVYQAYGNRLYRFSRQLGLSEADAEEIVQDTFMRLWVSRATLDSKAPIGHFIIVIARNLVYNALKKAATRKQHQLLAFRDVDNETEQQNSARELHALIRQAVDEMPEKRREVFHLSRFEGKMNEHIAEQLGISKRTVENQLNKALKFLRQRLKEYGYGALFLVFL
jgi:RNA polymerase sigma-70 factor (ECF subfamily)